MEIKRALKTPLGSLIQCINELEQREVEHRRALPGYVDQLKATMASAAAATGSTAGSTTTPADPSIRSLKTRLATMEAQLQQVQLTMENERRARSEFRHSILNSMSLMTTVPVTPAQPPLGPVPPSTDSDCFADQVRAQGERLTALENWVAGCNELIKEFKSQLQGRQGEKGVEEGPRDGALAIHGAHHPVHTPDFSGHSEMACQVADVHTHVHVTPHPHLHVKDVTGPCVIRRCVARSQQEKENQEKDAQPEKIKRKIVFSDLRNPPKNFTPLFGEVAKFRTLTRKEEQ